MRPFAAPDSQHHRKRPAASTTPEGRGGPTRRTAGGKERVVWEAEGGQRDATLTALVAPGVATSAALSRLERPSGLADAGSTCAPLRDVSP